jgi:hypothetical protein
VFHLVLVGFRAEDIAAVNCSDVMIDNPTWDEAEQRLAFEIREAVPASEEVSCVLSVGHNGFLPAEGFGEQLHAPLFWVTVDDAVLIPAHQFDSIQPLGT